MTLPKLTHFFNKESLILGAVLAGVGTEMKNSPESYDVHSLVREMDKWANNYNMVMSSEMFAKDAMGMFPEECNHS